MNLDQAVAGFLNCQRALARKYHSEEAELRLLQRFAAGRGATRLEDLTPALLEDFLASRPRMQPRSFNHLLGAVGCLLDWAVSQQLLDSSPLRARRRRTAAARIPFLLDLAQARQLLDAAAALPDGTRSPGRGPVYHAVFALCYGLGLRGGEACGLHAGDIDRDRELLIIKGGKFGKTRLVPHGPKIGQMLEEQLRRRSRDGRIADDAPLSTFNGRASISRHSASTVFAQLACDLGFTAPAGTSPPRLHSLRHSFAVGCLLRWYRQGLDPAARLPQLSTFMGHVDPSSTAVYLTITPALLEQASLRFEALAEPAWTAVAS